MNSLKTLLVLIFVATWGSQSFGQLNQTEEFIEVAQAAYDEGNYEKALTALDSALKYSPNNAGLYESKSDVLIDLQEFEAAGQILDMALEKFPYDALIHCKKGKHEIFIGRPENALVHYQDALELVTNDSLEFEIRIQIAVTKQDLRDFEGAYGELLQLYDIDQQNLNLLLSLGNIEEELDNNQRALKYYVKALDIDSNNVPVLMNIGYLLQEEENYSESYQY